jgi:hypothetical protein
MRIPGLLIALILIIFSSPAYCHNQDYSYGMKKTKTKCLINVELVTIHGYSAYAGTIHIGPQIGNWGFLGIGAGMELGGGNKLMTLSAKMLAFARSGHVSPYFSADIGCAFGANRFNGAGKKSGLFLKGGLGISFPHQENSYSSFICGLGLKIQDGNTSNGGFGYLTIGMGIYF